MQGQAVVGCGAGGWVEQGLSPNLDLVQQQLVVALQQGAVLGAKGRA